MVYYEERKCPILAVISTILGDKAVKSGLDLATLLFIAGL